MALKPLRIAETPFKRMRLLATLLLVLMAGVFVRVAVRVGVPVAVGQPEGSHGVAVGRPPQVIVASDVPVEMAAESASSAVVPNPESCAMVVMWTVNVPFCAHWRSMVSSCPTYAVGA